jgi:hypothetical protein
MIKCGLKSFLADAELSEEQSVVLLEISPVGMISKGHIWPKELHQKPKIGRGD